VGSVIIILHYPATSTRRMNLASENININLIYIYIYIKPKSWDVCRNFKETQNLQYIDDILRTFYKTDS
jgi:hypothetical protein